MTTTHTSQPSARPHGELSSGRHPIVVGVASIEHDLKALDWAVQEAESRRLGVHLVHCWEWPTVPPWTSEFDGLVISDLVHHGEVVLKKARSHIENRSDAAVTTEIVNGVASDVLTKLGQTATMIVLGSRQRRGLGRAMLGSVSNELVAHASCPVVVLGAPAAVPGTGAHVVAGVSGTDQDAAVLAFAFDEAQRRGAALKVILCWHPPLANEKLPPPDRAHAWLSEALAGWRQQYPDVEVHATVLHAHPADALVNAALSQELLVVGRREKRVRLGHVMGSVSLAVLHHATCPVALVPTLPH
jgi:nucleotide-binding universal stress UspA family protein